MDRTTLLDSFLKSYSAYYTLETENPLAPFAATGAFSIHNEQFMLVKVAKFADINSNEYVYFYSGETVDEEKLNELKETAWNDGISKVVPDTTHRNTDVTLYILCDSIPDEVKKAVKKSRYYKSYAFGFKGWSNFRLVAIECNSGSAVYNGQAKQLKELVGNILTY